MSSGLPCLLPYLAFSGISLAWGVDPDAFRRQYLLQLLFAIATWLLVERIGPWRALKALLYVLAAVAAMSAVAGLLVPSIGVHAASDQFANEHAGAWRGIMHHKNAFGALMAYAVVLGWPFGRALIAYRPALWAVRAVSLLCLVASQSVTAIAGAIVGVTAALILLREDRLSGWTLAKRIIALVVLALVLAVVGPTLVTLFGRDLTLSGRTDIWRLSWEMFAAHPLIGLGEGSADALLTPLLQKNLFPAAVDAHSGYLDRLVEVGIIGLTLLLGACFLALRRAMFGDSGNPQLRLGNRAFAACIIVALTQALGEIGPFRVYGTGFVLFYAIVCISARGRAAPAGQMS